MTFTDDMQTEAEAEPNFADLRPEQFVEVVTLGENLVDLLPEDKRQEIASTVHDDYEADKASMSDWYDRMKEGLQLARLDKGEMKMYPFRGAANIKFPLVTSAALQYNARAYPAIVAADRVAKCKTYGDDPSGMKAARADRVAEYESWQLQSQMPEWERDTDKLLLILPIVGTMHRKWWWDPVSARPRCRLIEPGKFVVNDNVQDLSLAPRCTEELTLYPYEIMERERSGWFAEFDWRDEGDASEEPHEFIEQHTRIDLDDDGYPEPYIATLHVESKTLVRLVADFAPEDVEFETETEMVEVQGSYVQEAMGPQGPVATVAPAVEMQEQQVPVGIQAIRRGSYFVSFTFIPSFDGKFHGTGFGALLGDISEAINTIINMMLDAGHYASLGGGFIGSGLRLRGGSSILAPGQYKNVHAQGMAIRENIVDRTFPGPDPTLFQLLGLLIEAGREVASVKDIMTGDAGPRQETATAMLARMEQGMAVFTASYKRIFRAIKEELRLLTQINATTVSADAYTAFHDAMDQMGQPQMLDPAQDFNLSDMDIEPVADPRSVTKMQMAAEAQFLLELAQGGLVNVGPAVARMLEAMDIRDTEELAPQPDPMAGPMAEMQMEAAHADLVLKKVEVEKVLAEVESERAKAVRDLTEAEAVRQEQRLSAIKISLEDERERLNAVIQGRNQRMAAQSRNGGAVSRGGGGTGGAGGGDALDVLEQQARQLAAGGATAGAGAGPGPL